LNVVGQFLLALVLFNVIAKLWVMHYKHQNIVIQFLNILNDYFSVVKFQICLMDNLIL